MTLSKALALIAMACSPVLAGSGRSSCTTKAVAVQTAVQVVDGKVLVPATISGHTNVLVAVPEAVAFSQIAVPVGVPVSSYSAVSYGQQVAQYQPSPAGQGLAHPANCNCRQSQGVEAQAVDDTTAQVTELFKTSCVACHSSAKHEGGFRLFDESGVLLKLPRKSILERVSTEDETLRMPKGSHAFTPEQVELVRKWSEVPKEVVW